MEKPQHYELAPITGENLRIAMDSYYCVYKRSPPLSFDIASKKLLSHLKEYKYPEITMNEIGALFEKAQQHIPIIINDKSMHQCDVLEIILYTEYRTFPLRVLQDGNYNYSAMAKTLAEIM